MTLHDQVVDEALEQEDQRTEDFHRDLEQHDRAAERADTTPPAPRCWHCGGSGVRCCEFSADLRADERRAAAHLHGHRSGTVTAAPIDPPVNDDTCSECFGTGRVHVGEWEHCDICSGTGRLS